MEGKLPGLYKYEAREANGLLKAAGAAAGSGQLGAEMKES